MVPPPLTHMWITALHLKLHITDSTWPKKKDFCASKSWCSVLNVLVFPFTRLAHGVGCVSSACPFFSPSAKMQVFDLKLQKLKNSCRSSSGNASLWSSCCVPVLLQYCSRSSDFSLNPLLVYLFFICLLHLETYNYIPKHTWNTSSHFYFIIFIGIQILWVRKLYLSSTCVKQSSSPPC